MKISKNYLKQIIKEELEKTLLEQEEQEEIIAVGIERSEYGSTSIREKYKNEDTYSYTHPERLAKVLGKEKQYEEAKSKADRAGISLDSDIFINRYLGTTEENAARAYAEKLGVPYVGEIEKPEKSEDDQYSDWGEE